MTKFSDADLLESNWNKFIDLIQSSFTGDRQKKLLKLYDDNANHIATAPASGNTKFHNAYPGGYVDHVLRVVDFGIKTTKYWKMLGIALDYTEEEMIFAAIHHDMGKLGNLVTGKPYYYPQTSDWHRKNRKELYTTKPEDGEWMTVPQMSLYNLQHYGVWISESEYLGILLHDGVFDDINKPYLAPGNPDKRTKAKLPYVLHQADFNATEYEKQFNSDIEKKYL